MSHSLIKFELLVELNPRLGFKISELLPIHAQGNGMYVWDFNTDQNDNEVYLIKIDERYWIAKIESYQTI